MIQIFGNIAAPPGVNKYIPPGGDTAQAAAGLIPFLTNIVRLLIVVGGVYALFNIILAGYGFLSAGDDPKKMASAWAKIWQSILGLVIIAGSFVIAGIIGWIVFKDVTAIIIPRVYIPE